MKQPTPKTARLLLFTLGVVVSALSHAQTTGDPTRPAPAWQALQPKAPGATVEVAPSTPGAQIVVVGPARKFAMVDGETVRPGDTYRGSKLLAIGPDGLIWQTEGRRELTSMSPAVLKTDPAARYTKQPGAKTRAKKPNGGPQ
jgi:MSHA biogenesis protein MshK